MPRQGTRNGQLTLAATQGYIPIDAPPCRVKSLAIPVATAFIYPWMRALLAAYIGMKADVSECSMQTSMTIRDGAIVCCLSRPMTAWAGIDPMSGRRLEQ